MFKIAASTLNAISGNVAIIVGACVTSRIGHQVHSRVVILSRAPISLNKLNCLIHIRVDKVDGD